MLVRNVDGEYDAPFPTGPEGEDLSLSSPLPEGMTEQDRERALAEAGFCRHGQYVGGCGFDFMCFYCEMGEEPIVLTAADHWAAFCRTWRAVTDLNDTISDVARRLLREGQKGEYEELLRSLPRLSLAMPTAYADLFRHHALYVEATERG
jgi:hypothetical protein